MKNPIAVYKIIIIVLLVIIQSVLIYFTTHDNPTRAVDHLAEHRKDHPLLDPALPFYDPKDLIVNIQELREYLMRLPQQNAEWADLSIYLEVLNTGANISVNNDLKVWPASLAKLPVGMIAMKKVERGEWSMDTQFTVLKEDADIVHTPEIANEIGKTFPLSFILQRLLLESDNTSYRMLVRSMTEQELVSIAEEVGLDQLFSEDAKMSAKEYMRLFRSLYSATYINENNSQMLLQLLQDSKFKNLMKAGLPDTVSFAHKWGINDQKNVYADAGIIYVPERPFMISVMIQGKGLDQKLDQQKADALMKNIAAKTYEYISSQ